MHSKFIVFFIVIILFGCNNKSYFGKTPRQVYFEDKRGKINLSSFNTAMLSSFLKSNKANLELGTGLLNINSNDFFLFKNYLGQIMYTKIDDTSNVHYTKEIGQYYTKVITMSSFAFFNSKLNIIKEIQIDSNHNLIELARIKVQPLKKHKNFSINTNIYSTNFDINSDFVLTNYSVYKPKNNFIDNTAFCSFKKNDNMNKESYLGYYPKKYMNEVINKRDAIFKICSDSTILMSFNTSDEIAKVKFNGEEIDRVKISPDTSFQKFDESKYKNLAYVDRYLQEVECNFMLIEDNKKNIILFKLKAKKDKIDPNVIICYVLDLSLKPKYTFQLKDETIPYLIYKYKNGFLCFRDKLKFADYYETN
jgi:hypothetical protein